MKPEFKGKSIFFFGDSITDEGYYLYHVRTNILKSKEKCYVYNHGVGGTRAEMGAYTVKDEVEPIAPDYMVVCFGSNDLGIWLYDSFLIQNEELEKSKFQRDQAFRTNMLAIIDFLQEKGIKPILMTPYAVNQLLEETDDIETLVDNKEKGEKITPAFYKRTTFERINKALKGYSDWLIQVGKERNIPVIDAHSHTYKMMLEKEGLFAKDGIHYSFEGATHIADVILDFLGYENDRCYERSAEIDFLNDFERPERAAQFVPWNLCHPLFGDYTSEDMEKTAKDVLANEKASPLNKRRAQSYLDNFDNRYQLRKEIFDKVKEVLGENE